MRNMTAVTGSDKYSRVETFLDNTDKVREPSVLEEPFRSLWLRVHGEMPTLMSEEDTRAAMSGMLTEQLTDVEITHSEGPDVDPQEKGSIEVVSPKDVGPTVEMKVKDNRVKFKAAGEEDLMAMRLKEAAAEKVVSIQKDTAPLKGIGGSAARVITKVRDMALRYRDGEFQQVVEMADEIGSTIHNEEFRRSLLIEIQGKITDYGSLGGDLALAKERFKELSVSYKEGKEDFLPLAQAVNALAEEAIKGLVTSEEVVLAEIKEPSKPGPDVVKEGPSIEKEVTVIPVKRNRPKPTEKKEDTPPEEVEGEGETAKPVIRIVKKKILVLKKETPASPNKDPKPISREGPSSTEKENIESDPRMDPQDLENGEGEVPTVEEIMAEQNKSVKKAIDKNKDGPERSAIDGAFKKIDLVYKASVKMHERGKDVSGIFDIIKMAEQARQKGDMRMYVGLAGQLESMLIAMQK